MQGLPVEIHLNTYCSQFPLNNWKEQPQADQKAKTALTLF